MSFEVYGVVVTRPWTPDYVDLDGVKHMTVKRCCNGCGRQLGDVTDDEMDAAVAGILLPDVRDECGCEKEDGEQS